MGFPDLLDHLLGFAAPAFAVGLLVALMARWTVLRGAATRAWWIDAGINSAAGVLALGAGLWSFGVDGKMLSYAALVLAVASTQWLLGRGWRG